MARIALIRQQYRPDGGAERSVNLIARAMVDAGHEVGIIARRWDPRAVDRKQVHLLRCDPPGSSRVARERNFAHAACELLRRESFDLVQSHERIPIGDIYRAGDGVHRCWLDRRAAVQGPLARAFVRCSRFHRYMLEAERQVFERPQLRAAVCNSKMVRDEVADRFDIDPTRLHIIPNAVDTSRFLPPDDATRAAARRSLAVELHCPPLAEPDTPLLLLVGSGFARKGVDIAMAAQHELRTRMDEPPHLLVAGRDKNMRQWRTLRHRLGLEGVTHLPGRVDDVVRGYHAADAMILPTLYDPMPNVLVEALACGLAVITSDGCGGAEEAVAAGCGFVHRPRDAAGFAQSIEALLARSREDRRDIAARARRLAESHAVDRIAGRWVTLLASILGRTLG